MFFKILHCKEKLYLNRSILQLRFFPELNKYNKNNTALTPLTTLTLQSIIIF